MLSLHKKLALGLFLWATVSPFLSVAAEDYKVEPGGLQDALDKVGWIIVFLYTYI